jgi:hypothetical protein
MVHDAWRMMIMVMIMIMMMKVLCEKKCRLRSSERHADLRVVGLRFGVKGFVPFGLES